MNRTLSLWQICTIIAIVSIVAAAVLWPVRTVVVQPPYCLSNIKQLSMVEIMYANDFDDKFPLADNWYDSGFEYRRTDISCTEVPKTFNGKKAIGYALNDLLAALLSSCVESPEQMVLLYDSVNLLPNAHDDVSSLPVGGRHGPSGETRRNTIAYVDGHAKSIPWGQSPGIAQPVVSEQCVKKSKAKK